MPSYSVTDPQTGKSLTLTGDSPPSEAELVQIFGSNASPQDPMAAFSDRQGSDFRAAQEAQALADAAPSPLGSFGREAARSVIPAIAGFASGAASGAAAGAMGLNPVTVGIGAIGGSILGVMGTRLGQDKISDAVAPESFMGTESAAQDWQTNPISSLVGGAVAQGKFSPGRALGAGKTIATQEGRALLASAAKGSADPAARAALTDVVDVGLGAGIGTGMSLAMGDGMAAENAVVGSLFSKPWIGGARGPLPPMPEAPPVNTNTGLVPTQGLPSPVEGARRSPAVVDVDQEAQRGSLINELEDEFVQNRARRERLGKKYKDDGKPLNSGDGRKMITILDARAKAIESQLVTLRSGEIVTPPAQPREIVEIDNRQPGARTMPEAGIPVSPESFTPTRNEAIQQPAPSPDLSLRALPMESQAAAPVAVEPPVVRQPENRDPAAVPAEPNPAMIPATVKESLTVQPDARRYARAGTVETDPHQQDFIDFIADHRINIPADKSGGEMNGFREWHQSIPPLYKSERHFSTAAGSSIDVVANEAFRAGLIDAPDSALLMDKFSKTIGERKLARTTGDLNPLEIKALAQERKAPRQAREFDTALVKNRRSRAGEKVLAGELAEGETFHFDGERFKVTKSDTVEGFDGPEGLVVIQDHDRFGTQVVDAAQPLRIADKDAGQVWQHEADRADEMLSRRQPADSEPIPDVIAEDAPPSFLTEPKKPAPASEMDARNANARELFDDDGGFALGQESTVDGAKVAASRAAKESAAAEADAAQGRLLDDTPPTPEAKKSILDGLKSHRASVDKSIKDGRGKSFMAESRLLPDEVNRAALDIAISRIEAGQSVNKAVRAAIAHIKSKAGNITAAEAKAIERRLFAEVNAERVAARGRAELFKSEMSKAAQEFAGRGIAQPTMGDLVNELAKRFPDQAKYIRANGNKLFDEMLFHNARMAGKSVRAREWSDWTDSAMEQAAKVSEWATKGTPFRDIGDKLNLFNKTFFGTLRNKALAAADGRLTGRESPAFMKLVDDLFGKAPGSGGVHSISQDLDLQNATTAHQNRLQKIEDEAAAFVSKLPRRGRDAFWRRVTDHIVDPSRDGELAKQPELKKAVEGIIKLRTELYELQIAAGVDMGNAGPRSMRRMTDYSRILGNEKEFVAQAANAYRDAWKREIAALNVERNAARAAGDKAKAASLGEKIKKIQAQDADDFAERYLYAQRSDDLGISTDGEGDLYAPVNGKPNSEKSRVFGPEADQFLGKFYERNAQALMSNDINSAHRAAAVAKILSGKNPDGSIDPLGGWKKFRAAMEAEGNQESIPLAAAIVKNYFNLGGHVGEKTRKLLELAHMHTQIGRLSHAMAASFGDPTLIAMRHGGGIPAYAKAYAATAKGIFDRMRGASPGEWRIIADFMGVTSDGLTSMTAASRHMDAWGGKLGGKLVSRFHQLSGLSALTNSTHAVALEMGHSHILGHLKIAQTGGKLANWSKNLLNQVGIKSGEIDDVLKFAEKLQAAPDKVALLTADTPEAVKYRAALRLFRNSGATLEPTRGSRPEWANHPLGALYYQLSSFLYDFHDKVAMRGYKQLYSAAKGETTVDGSTVALNASERRAMAWNTLQGFAAIGATAYGVQTVREALLRDPVRAEKDKKRSAADIQKSKLASAASRTGFLGPYDALYNIITGARYNRDPSGAFHGAALGGAFQMTGSLIRLLNEKYEDSINDRITPRSNVNARKFGRDVSDMIVRPGISAAATTLPGGAIPAAIIQGASHPAFREVVTKAVGGPMRIQK